MAETLEQAQLAFEAAEASARERWARLAAALDQIGANLYHVTFCRMVFSQTRQGEPGVQWVASLERLRRRPDGLCCSRSTVCATIRDLRMARIVSLIQRTDRAGRREPTAYAIDWDGVAWRLGQPRDARPEVRDVDGGVRNTDLDVRSSDGGVRDSDGGVRNTDLEVRSSDGGVRSSDGQFLRMDDDDGLINTLKNRTSSSSSSSSDLHRGEGSGERGPAVAVASPPAEAVGDTLIALETLRGRANALRAAMWPDRVARLRDEEREWVLEFLLAAQRVPRGAEWLERAVARTVAARPRNPLRYLRAVLARDLPDYLDDVPPDAASCGVALAELLRSVRRAARQADRRLRATREAMP